MRVKYSADDMARIFAAAEDRTMDGHEAAKHYRVAYACIWRVRRIIRFGSDELIADVRAGRTYITSAYNSLLPDKAAKEKDRMARRIDRAPRQAKVIQLPLALPIRSLTREQVDPELAKDPHKFAVKYGHVHVKTAEQRTASEFMKWLSAFRAFARASKTLPTLDLAKLGAIKEEDAIRMLLAIDSIEAAIAKAKAVCEATAPGKKEGCA